MLEGYPVLCQCGGNLVTESTTAGHLAGRHDVYRVHCTWCPLSSRWLSHEADCLEEISSGMKLKEKPERTRGDT